MFGRKERHLLRINIIASKFWHFSAKRTQNWLGAQNHGEHCPLICCMPACSNSGLLQSHHMCRCKSDWEPKGITSSVFSPRKPCNATRDVCPDMFSELPDDSHCREKQTHLRVPRPLGGEILFASTRSFSNSKSNLKKNVQCLPFKVKWRHHDRHGSDLINSNSTDFEY